MPDIHQPVKMVRHQTVAQKISIRQNVSPHLFQEKKVIILSEKDWLTVITLIIDMIDKSGFKIHRFKFGLVAIGEFKFYFKVKQTQLENQTMSNSGRFNLLGKAYSPGDSKSNVVNLRNFGFQIAV